MCGIFGIYQFNETTEVDVQKLRSATETLEKRGPDANGIYTGANCGLGHTRLSIIDLSDAASQPMTDESKRYTIVFNGECYNYRELREKLRKENVSFFSQSDTEVILKMYIRYGTECLQYFNGCFAFAVYDNKDKSLFAARDRLGIKPLLYYYDNRSFVFASELRALIKWGIPKDIDYTALAFYFQLNYIPAPLTPLKNTFKLMPGQYITASLKGFVKNTYWVLPSEKSEINDYNLAKSQLKTILTSAVERRLVSDVPLGCFLSGGIDSAIITGLASEIKPDICTFNVSFPGNEMYDESQLAEITARKHKTKHSRIEVSQKELIDNIYNVLDTTDEPYADSSAIALNILSKVTRKHVTVALSGDGADELFAGYNKHAAHLRAMNKPFSDYFYSLTSPLLSVFPESRSGKIPDKARKLRKYLKGRNVSDTERYWLWCGLMEENISNKLLIKEYDKSDYSYIKKLYTSNIEGRDFNEILYSDLRLVLANDMLTKTDKFSMSEGLEVRVPFLDHSVVEFVTGLDSSFKINRKSRKVILKETFSHLIPEEVLNGKKHGFEVPVEKWLKNELNDLLKSNINAQYIKSQGVLNNDIIVSIENKLNSGSPGDSPAQLWAILVFQYWWKKYID